MKFIGLQTNLTQIGLVHHESKVLSVLVFCIHKTDLTQEEQVPNNLNRPRVGLLHSIIDNKIK